VQKRDGDKFRQVGLKGQSLGGPIKEEFIIKTWGGGTKGDETFERREGAKEFFGEGVGGVLGWGGVKEAL